MKQKLIAIDLDGTTLDGQSNVSFRTKTALQKVVALGHKVAIVTGRPFRSAKPIYEALDLDSPIVTFNGAQCHNPHNPNWTGAYHIPLDLEVANDLIEYFPALNLDFLMVESKDDVYTNTMDIPESPYYPDQSGLILLQKDRKLTTPPTTITVFSPADRQESLRSQLLNRYGNHAIDVRTWGGDFPCLEVITSGVQKAVGVERLSHTFKIGQEDILAFGDEDNDREMLEYAGLGVAMQNAIPELKALANDVTPLPNTEDGLAYYLADYFHFDIEN